MISLSIESCFFVHSQITASNLSSSPPFLLISPHPHHSLQPPPLPFSLSSPFLAVLSPFSLLSYSSSTLLIFLLSSLLPLSTSRLSSRSNRPLSPTLHHFALSSSFPLASFCPLRSFIMVLPALAQAARGGDRSGRERRLRRGQNRSDVRVL